MTVSLSTALGKRLLDIVASGGALIVGLPVIAIVALAVRLDTPGPVIFRQIRVGRHGRHFRILKFRTMADRPIVPGEEITVHRDPRITRSGRFLRHWKLDELPQLWNVLRGDMSVVGPRPEVPRYVELYPADQRALILSVRPGVTDPASIKYRSEADMLAGAANPEQMYREIILPDKIALAAEYAGNVSFLSDISIIFRTLRRIVA